MTLQEDRKAAQELGTHFFNTCKALEIEGVCVIKLAEDETRSSAVATSHFKTSVAGGLLVEVAEEYGKELVFEILRRLKKEISEVKENPLDERFSRRGKIEETERVGIRVDSVVENLMNAVQMYKQPEDQKSMFESIINDFVTELGENT